MLTPYELILKKQNHYSHSKEEIDFIVNGYLKNIFTDYHMAAWLMAVYFNGMNKFETVNYTSAIINSGKKIHWKNLDGFIVDKHSTGGG